MTRTDNGSPVEDTADSGSEHQKAAAVVDMHRRKLFLPAFFWKCICEF